MLHGNQQRFLQHVVGTVLLDHEAPRETLQPLGLRRDAVGGEFGRGRHVVGMRCEIVALVQLCTGFLGARHGASEG